MLELYDHPNSSCALRVRFLLAELELPYERRRVRMSRPRPAEYLSLNPIGGIPTLVDDGFVLSESHAILQYLAGRERRTDLLPTDLRRRAAVDELLDRFATGLRSQLWRHEEIALGYADGEFDAVPRNPEAAAAIELEIRPALVTLERVVAQDGTAIGGGTTIADFSLAPALHRTFSSGLSLDELPKLRHLRDTITTRTSWQHAHAAI